MIEYVAIIHDMTTTSDRPSRLLGTREAAELYGVRPSNFIRDWASRPDFPAPAARLASGRVWDRTELERYRLRRGPRRAVPLKGLPLTPLAARWLPVVKRRIVRRFHPARIVLFGSQVRGDARPDSDADLLVVLSGHRGLVPTPADVHAALVGIPLAKDIIVATERDLMERADTAGTILGPALEEGRTIYAAS